MYTEQHYVKCPKNWVHHNIQYYYIIDYNNFFACELIVTVHV